MKNIWTSLLFFWSLYVVRINRRQVLLSWEMKSCLYLHKYDSQEAFLDVLTCLR